MWSRSNKGRYVLSCENRTRETLFVGVTLLNTNYIPKLVVDSAKNYFF